MEVSLNALWLLLLAFLSTEGKSINPGNRVIGGTAAEEGVAPYQVSLQSRYFLSHSCGGSIISDRYILTAGHCVYGRALDYFVVIAGTNEWRKPGAKYYVDKTYIHCNFNDPEMQNDVALLYLNESIAFNERTQPIKLPKKPLDYGVPLLLTGWGSTELWGSNSDNLQAITLKYQTYNECLEALEYDPALGVGAICTIAKEGEGACHGDSGGPLVYDGTLYGIVSWGRPCALGKPDVYTSTYYYSDWIRTVLSGNMNRCLM